MCQRLQTLTNDNLPAKTVVVCDSQPVTIEGMRSLLAGCEDLKFAGAVTTLLAGMELVRGINPSAVLIDKGFGLQAISDWLAHLRAQGSTAAIVWGLGIGEAEALKMLQAGAQGVIRKTTDISSMLNCLRSVTNGTTWMEDTIFHEIEKPFKSSRSNLTAREHQVVELVEKGLKNKDIARNLGIQTGTVKIHLKHIFEKTGVRGRYGLALSGLKEKGYLSLSPM